MTFQRIAGCKTTKTLSAGFVPFLAGVPTDCLCEKKLVPDLSSTEVSIFTANNETKSNKLDSFFKARGFDGGDLCRRKLRRT